eukprot:CAMPEP_0183743540 /NCGR_PEP_ID=MMETSP0737-20130205/65265_1 /TAXON_ID=385413 /ORGANISM="Thalassiosira miniscula, Strain CCMP1093" /LENGTH=262 /DNA_ID=CAMNT_0025979161 /DNA_START=617 /DNA_END=1406 /DNA_ORIENTATION=-
MNKNEMAETETDTTKTNIMNKNEMKIKTKRKSTGNRQRPRSKSCDRLTRHHSPTVHKKKQSTNHLHSRRRLPGNISALSSPSHHQQHGRVSPIKSISSPSSSSNSQQLRGRLWIRPVAVRRNMMHFQPVTVLLIELSATSRQVMDPTCGSAEEHDALSARISSSGALPSVDPAEHLVRDIGCVDRSCWDYAPVSYTKQDPLVRSRTASPVLFDDDIMLYAALSPNSSFDSIFHQSGKTTKNSKSSRIIFGESGKPIKPRNGV